jgi:hypothetical protein
MKHLSQSFGSARAHNMLTALKAFALVAAVWGVVYPALLWSLEQLLH